MKSTKQHRIRIITQQAMREEEDVVAVEDPLEIQIIHPDLDNGRPTSLSITMRTPGHDTELATGFLFTEGVINKQVDIQACQQVSPNHVWVTLAKEVKLAMQSLERNFYTTSSCGVCGKASINAIKTTSTFTIEPLDRSFSSIDLFSLQDKILGAQTLFSKTGGIHAAALFRSTGELIALREDVGRHNALDKLIGHLLQEDGLPARNAILLLSGRASFELIQKASMAGIACVVAVGAPSSLAIELASEMGMTLIGFLKTDRYNVYTTPTA